MIATAAQSINPKPPFALPGKPVDKHRVEYYRVSGYGDDPYIMHVCCVYHVNSTWLEVCPDRTDRPGAAFVDQWQVFTDGDFCGRSNNGWDAVLCGHWDKTFGTYEEANAHLLDWLGRSLKSARKKVSDIERRIETAHGAPEKTVTCPSCEPKEWEKNHPPGMIFVGMGHGWQPCSKCGGAARVRAEDAHD